MPAGKYRHRIKLYEPRDLTDDAGQTTSTYVEVEPIWAEVKATAGRELVRNNQIDAELVYYIRIRFREDITSAWRVVYSGKTIELSKVLDVGEEHRELELVGTAVL